jgi:hypothetical protein
VPAPLLRTTKRKPLWFSLSSPPARTLPPRSGNEPSTMVPVPAPRRNFLRFIANLP